MGKGANRQIILCAVASLALSACATGSGGLSLMSASQERQIGAEEHPKLVAEFGGAYADKRVADYVTSVGAKLGKVSDEPETPYSFTVLDSPVENAFALPGGYVHISRGLMVMMNSEDELGSVLGHEIGHITEHHTAKRYTKSTVTQGLGALVGIVTRNEGLANLVNYGGQLYVLSYSRDQELQSDKVGMTLLGRANDDPAAAVSMLQGLDAVSKLEASLAGQTDNTPSIFRTHPVTSERIKKAQELVPAQAAGVAAPDRGRDRYLAAIDGMIFGDDPKQGVIKGQDFLHPGLRFAFTAPKGYQLQNTADAIYAMAPDGRIQVGVASVAASTNLSELLQRQWANLTGGKAGKLANVQGFSANGMTGTSGVGQINDGQNAADVRLAALRLDDKRIFLILCVAPYGKLAAVDDGFKATLASFRHMSAAQAATFKPLRLRVVTVKSSDTVESLGARMDVAKAPTDWFRVLNALGPNDKLKPGQKVKLVLEEGAKP